MKTLSLASPAKVNLVLRVVGKRADGYHNLSTIFEKIDLCDELKFTPRADGRVRVFCDHPAVPPGPKNLVYQAAEMLQKDLGVKLGADIVLAKRIPVAGGLGGGSSNAATALKGLNALWGLGLPPQKLVFYAKKLGADVPFFIYNNNYAYGTERGDRIKPLKITKKLWHILVFPRFKVFSGEVFRAFKMELTKPNDNVNILTRALRKGSFAKVNQALSNDLETAIVRVHPRLRPIIANIRNMIGNTVIFSGSGPSIFGLAESEQQAKEYQALLRRHYRGVCVARTYSSTVKKEDQPWK